MVTASDIHSDDDIKHTKAANVALVLGWCEVFNDGTEETKNSVVYLYILKLQTRRWKTIVRGVKCGREAVRKLKGEEQKQRVGLHMRLIDETTNNIILKSATG